MQKVNCANCKSANPINSRYCMDCGHELPKVEVVRPVEDFLPKPKSKRKKTLTIIGIVLGIIVVGVGYRVVGYYVVNKLLTPAFDQQMMVMASEINKTCPLMVDAATQLDNTICLPNKTFQYNYTLVGVDKNQVDTNELKDILEPTIISQLQSNPQMQAFRDNYVTINYLYRDKTGAYLAMITISPEEYK